MAHNAHPAAHTRTVELTDAFFLAVLATVVLKTLSFLFVPLCIALLFCYAMGAPLDLLRKVRLPNWLRIGIVVVSILLVLYLIGSLVHANVRAFQRQLPEFEVKFWGYLDWILLRLEITPDQAREMFAAFVDNFKQADLKPLGNMAQKLGGSFFAFLGNVLWVLLFVIFILADRESLGLRLNRGFGEEQAIQVQETAQRINLAVQHYLGLKTLVSLITGGLVALVLWLFGVYFALLWGVLAFFANFIPNIGSLAATVPPVAIVLFQFGSPARAALVAVLLTIIQMVVGNFVEPRLMGKGLNLSPLVVLLALLFWGWMWGLTGMLLAVPLTAALKIALEQIDRTRPIAVLMSGR